MYHVTGQLIQVLLNAPTLYLLSLDLLQIHTTVTDIQIGALLIKEMFQKV